MVTTTLEPEPAQDVSPQLPPKEPAPAADAQVEQPVSPSPPVSPTMVLPSLPDFNCGHARLFVDICSGATCPLSSAILAKGGAMFLTFDILLDQ